MDLRDAVKVKRLILMLYLSQIMLKLMPETSSRITQVMAEYLLAFAEWHDMSLGYYQLQMVAVGFGCWYLSVKAQFHRLCCS